MKNTELIEQKQIEDTPFTLVRYEKNYFMTLGKYRLTEPMENEVEVRKYLSTHRWEITLQLIEIMAIEREEHNTKAKTSLKEKKQVLTIKK